MIEQENNNSFDWVYYILGMFFGILTAVIVTGSFGAAILGGIIGFIFGAIFLNGIVKGREY
jgi:membrane-bound ClpP family serine protease